MIIGFQLIKSSIQGLCCSDVTDSENMHCDLRRLTSDLDQYEHELFHPSKEMAELEWVRRIIGIAPRAWSWFFKTPNLGIFLAFRSPYK